MRKFVLITWLLVILVSLTARVEAAPPGDPPGLERAIAAQEAHNPRLLAMSGVVGTAVGPGENGQPAVMICTERAGVPGLPGSLDGVPVRVKVTGKFTALKPPPGGSGKALKPTDKWPTPVPIGVSTGNINSCSAGTIGARVVKAGGVYALSNNHVYALENKATIGDIVLQPGLYDTRCRLRGNTNLGRLSDYEPLYFDGTINYMDAAIASTSTSLLDKGTPPDGYGVPISTVEASPLGISVQKYGRTTRLTTGLVYAINYAGNIGYNSGYAYFEQQILVWGSTPFSKSGDSGSLVVTSSDSKPVGLLFAGDTSGTWTIASPISLVLSRFGLNVDGQ